MNQEKRENKNMENLRHNVIDTIKKTYTWMQYERFIEKIDNQNKLYTLMKFTDKICGEIILWVYLYETEGMFIEFRNAMTAEIEHSFKYDSYKDFVINLEDIKYLY